VRVLMVPNTANPAAVAAAGELAVWCTARGLEPVLATSDAIGSGLDRFAAAPSELGEVALVVALGGDGTILKAVHLLGEKDTPVLGVKFGRLGFLSGARAETMREAIESALADDVCIERRATLAVEVVMDGRVVGTYRALNEVAVSRGASGRVVGFELSINGNRLVSMRADGVVVATATGSTAYALSAGGPIVAPGHGGLVIVPVAPHTLRSRPIVTGPSDVVEIVLNEPARADACLSIDGDLMPCRQAIERITVRRGDHDVSLVKLDGRSFFQTVAEEFFGG